MRVGIVVGYLGANTTNELYTMVGGCFTQTGDAKQFSLKDLSVNGYEPSTEGKASWTGGCKAGSFELLVLKNDGNPDKAYYWADATTGTLKKPTVWAPGWYQYDSVNDTYVKMEDAAVAAIKFDLGQAFWTKGVGYNLVSAGAVSPLRMEFKTNDDLYTAVGNGMPVNLTLGDIYVNGYAPSTEGKASWTGGCKAGSFELLILKNDGNPDAAYYWADATTGTLKKPTVWAPGWYQYDAVGDTYVKMPDEAVAAVKITAG